MTFSLAQQIEEIEREIRMRREVFPRMVSKGKMKQSAADYHLARMVAVLETLRALEAAAASVKGTIRMDNE